MKLFLIITLLILSSASFATKTADGKLKEQETEIYLAQAKAREIEEQLSESELLKACKENKKTNKEIEDCVKDVFEKNPDAAEEFADKVNLKSFDLNASKNSTSIRKYLSERLRKALYGEPQKGKMQKLVDHEVYSKLYRSQIGKNILMEVSNYCIVNLGFDGEPYQVVNHCVTDKDGKVGGDTCTAAQSIEGQAINLLSHVIDLSGSGNENTPPPDKTNKPKIQITKKFLPEKFGVVSQSNRTHATFWKSLTEYDLNEACVTEHMDGNKCQARYTLSDGEIVSRHVRNASFLNAVKELEFKLGPKYMKEKYQFCAFTAINTMCEVYKCRNVYHKQTEKPQKDICDAFGITDYNDRANAQAPHPKAPKEQNHAGSKACSLMAKLKQYRQNIATLDVIDEYNKGLKVKKGLVDGKRRDGNHIAVYQGGSYGYGNSDNEKSIEEITTISSDELAGKSELGMSEEELDALRQECLSDSGSLSEEEKCQQLISDLGEDATNVTAELESETQLYLKRIEAIQADDKETIKQYLIKHGLSKHIAALEGGTLDTSILKKLIADEYKSEREALKKSMMDKFNRLTKKDDDPAAPAAASTSDELTDAELATENIENIAKQKETIQTLFQYNNVISSYMSAKVGEGEDAEETELSYQRDIELQGMSEFGEEETKAKAEEYTKMFEDENARESSGNEQMNVDLNFIDSLLGNKEDKKKTP